MNQVAVCQQIYQVITRAKNILVLTHCQPDGDAAASLSAMAQVLRFLNKRHVLFCVDPFEKKLLFLPGLRQVVNHIDDASFDAYDLIITVDCGTVERSCLADKILNRKAGQVMVEIDHHEPVATTADYELRVSAAASTTEVIYEWLKINNLTIGPEMAEAILLGLITDTGNFIYSATSEKTMAIASEMLARGANWPKIIKAAKTKADLAAAKLWGLVLSRLTVNYRYQVAFAVARQVDFKQCGAAEGSLDGLAGFLSRLTDVRAVLLLVESSDGVLRGSWRSCRDDINVAKLSNYLGGGGHAKAAGFQLRSRLVHDGKHWQIV